MPHESSRRQFLRGAAGLSLALPFLRPPEARAQQGGVPKRLLLFYVAEGVEPRHWWPAGGAGTADFALPASLAPLEPFRRRLTIVKGINTESTKPIRSCYHQFCMPHVLTGGPLSPELRATGPREAAVTFPPGASIDRVIGRFLQGTAPFQTYELGVRASADRRFTTLSFDRKDAGRYPENDPYKVFTTLFGAGGPTPNPEALKAIEEAHGRRMSVLDHLKGELASLRCKLGQDGLQKLDAHLTSVRTIEQQLASLHASRRSAGTLSVGSEWSTQHRSIGAMPDYARLQMEIVRTMLAADQTRVAMIQFGHTISRWTFPFVPGITLKTADHHDKLSHAEGAVKSFGVSMEQVIEEKRRVYTWFGERFRDMLALLDGVPEPNGKLLDNTAVVYFSEMGYGQTHSPNNIPVIVAGGAQGAFKLGQYLDLNGRYKGLYGRATDGGRSINDLWQTLAQGLGVRMDGFGERAFSKGVIPELLV